jgi:phosphoribosyl-AMP cyclohydrolase / phosphoribosyl-ATP pyrophosphohydrolase
MLEETLALQRILWDERGLIPAIIQDAETHEVLILAYMNRQALQLSLDQGEVWLWSRSRCSLWHKGGTSGNIQRICEIRVDCDADALLVLVHPTGPACHTGARSCFFRTLQTDTPDSFRSQGILGNEEAR